MRKFKYEVIGMLKQGRRKVTFMAIELAISEKLAKKHTMSAFPNLEVQSVKILENEK